MRQISNVHVHTNWCDGENTAREMAEAALALGFSDLGFSSHSPAPFDPACPGITDEAGYRADVAAAKAEFAGRLGILCGVEQDYYAPVRRADYDYRVGSVHYLRFADGTYATVDASANWLRQTADERFAGDAMAMVREYFATYVKNVAQYRPEVGGHFDVIKKHNREAALFDEASPAYHSAALAAADEAARLMEGYGGMFEVNTGGFYRGYTKELYPSLFILKHLAQVGARVIITTDCHKVSTLTSGFDEALAHVQKAGFTSMAVLQNGAFRDVNI